LLQGVGQAGQGPNIEVLLAYHPSLSEENPCILEAYRSVLEEEGVPFRTLEAEALVSRSPENLPEGSAVILPDGLNQMLPEGFDGWVKRYLENGGSVLIGYDAGTKDPKGLYREQSVFTDLLGLNTILYTLSPERAYSNGSLRFADRAALELLEIPPGKTNETLDVIGYQYRTLTYPFARSAVTGEVSSRKVFASMIDGAGETSPAIVEVRHGKGIALYTGVPLGYLKCYSDELLLRSSIRYFLFNSVKIPHLMSAPGGKGGVVINWHIDSNAEWVYLPLLKKKGYFRNDLKYSFHITAGEYNVEVGDRQGFDASGKGRKMVEMILPYGVIGSHGGWGHDWFANRVASGEFKEKEIEAYITKNNKSLEEIAGYRMEEYSAPVGVHPQPAATLVLERLGMIAYYYTGDQGAGPNRTFANGRKVSDRVIAFPVTNYGHVVSIEEMKLAGKTPREVNEWLTGVVDYAARHRVVRLIYSHPNDVKYYPKTVWDFLDHLSSLQKEGKLRVETMTHYAKFLLRFLKTTHQFTDDGSRLTVLMKNPEGLQEMAVAVPKGRFGRPGSPPPGTSIEEDESYFYVTVREEGVFEKVLHFPRL
jgi:hypothetical protein